MRTTIEISWSSLWKIFFFLIFVAILISGEQILLGLFLAVVISAGLDFLVDRLEKWGIPRPLGVILIFLLGIIIFFVIAYAVIPFLIADLNTVLSKFNKPAAAYWLGPLINFRPDSSITLFVNRLSSQLFSGDLSPVSTFSDVLGGVGLVVAVLVSSFYLSINRDGIERFIRAIFPNDYEEEAIAIYKRARRKIGFWFQTQLVLSFVLGFLAWFSLFMLGVRHAIVLAFVAAFFELVPFVGPIVSGGIAILVAWTTSPALAGYTLIVFLAIHQLESHVLVPLLTRRSVGLHPVIVIGSLLIGLEIAGLLGALIAVPAAAVIQEVVESWSVHRKLTVVEDISQS